MDRCTACLLDVDPELNQSQVDYRREGTEAFARASAVIYPSEFLRRQLAALFPDCREGRIDAVIAPATSRPAALARRPDGRANIAFVGGAHLHKGGALIAPTMEHILKREPAALGFVYGSGDGSLARQLRRTTNIRVRGYYRQDRLPSLLVRDRIKVAVLSSIWPEAYGLVVDECLSVGVPVVAFNHGAVADRLRKHNVIDLVPLTSAAEGLANSVIGRLSHFVEFPFAVMSALPQPRSASQHHIAIYQAVISSFE